MKLSIIWWKQKPRERSTQGDLSVKQWSVSTYLPSHTELITYCESWECSSSIMLNPVDNLAAFLLEFYYISYCSHPFFELFPRLICVDSSLPCFPIAFQAAPSDLLSSLLSFTDHLAVCTPLILVLVLCSPVSLCNLFFFFLWGVGVGWDSPFTLGSSHVDVLITPLSLESD